MYYRCSLESDVPPCFNKGFSRVWENNLQGEGGGPSTTTAEWESNDDGDHRGSAAVSLSLGFLGHFALRSVRPTFSFSFIKWPLVYLQHNNL